MIYYLTVPTALESINESFAMQLLSNMYASTTY